MNKKSKENKRTSSFINDKHMEDIHESKNIEIMN